MGVLEEARTERDARIGTRCVTCRWIESQSAEDQAEWAAVMVDRSFTNSLLWSIMRKRGFRYGEGTIRNHRTKHAS